MRIRIAFCGILLFAVSGALAADPYLAKRQAMVEQDIKGRGIRDGKVLEAMGKVPRHLFVGNLQRWQAYGDHPLPIGEGQTISQPYVVALMTETLRVKPTDRVLEIGTGSGYQAAVLAGLVREVYSIEIRKPLAEMAEKRLKEMGYRNVTVKFGDGYFGWQEHAPFDATNYGGAHGTFQEQNWRRPAALVRPTSWSTASEIDPRAFFGSRFQSRSPKNGRTIAR